MAEWRDWTESSSVTEPGMREMLRAAAIYLWNVLNFNESRCSRILSMTDVSTLEMYWKELQHVHGLVAIEQACTIGREIEFEFRHQKKWILCPGDASYPLKVMALPHPPVLCVRGDVSVLKRPQIAMVGSRRVIEDARRIAPRIADGVMSRGYIVTSGGAMGIDALAHRQAMKRNKPTIVVSATGVDKWTPVGNRDIYEYAAQCGAIVSQFRCGPVGYEPNFPLRNHVIAGLSDATIVVQSRLKGGALYTSGMSEKLRRPVYIAAMPGFEELCAGNWDLYKKGRVRLIADDSDLDDLSGGEQLVIDFGQDGGEGGPLNVSQVQDSDVSSHPLPPGMLSQTQDWILSAVETVPLTRDGIRQKVEDISRNEHNDGAMNDFDEGLLELELCGLIRFVGGRFCRA